MGDPNTHEIYEIQPGETTDFRVSRSAGPLAPNVRRSGDKTMSLSTLNGLT